MCIMGIETLQCYFQHKRMCNFCCSNTNFVPSKLLLNLQHFYQDFRLSWRSFIGFCVYQVYREHRLSGFPFIRFCVYPIVSFLSYRIVRVSYRIVRVSYRIVYQVFRFLSCFAFIRSIVYRVLRVSGFPFIVSCIFGNYRDHNLNIRKMYDTFRKLHSFCLRSYF